MVEDDVMVDGGVCGSIGASQKKRKLCQSKPGSSKRDAKSQTGKSQKIDVKTVDIRKFWKLKGSEVPGDLNFNQSNKTV